MEKSAEQFMAAMKRPRAPPTKPRPAVLRRITAYSALLAFGLMRRRDALARFGAFFAIVGFAFVIVARLPLGDSRTAKAKARALLTRGLYQSDGTDYDDNFGCNCVRLAFRHAGNSLPFVRVRQ
jgi:hypothetical protein